MYIVIKLQSRFFSLGGIFSWSQNMQEAFFLGTDRMLFVVKIIFFFSLGGIFSGSQNKQEAFFLGGIFSRRHFCMHRCNAVPKIKGLLSSKKYYIFFSCNQHNLCIYIHYPQLDLPKQTTHFIK